MDAETDLVRRAFAAYFRPNREGFMPAIPSSTDISRVEIHDEKRYVVLRNTGGVLAVFRIRGFDGVLKRLKRWPDAIDAEI